MPSSTARAKSDGSTPRRYQPAGRVSANPSRRSSIRPVIASAAVGWGAVDGLAAGLLGSGDGRTIVGAAVRSEPGGSTTVGIGVGPLAVTQAVRVTAQGRWPAYARRARSSMTRPAARTPQASGSGCRTSVLEHLERLRDCLGVVERGVRPRDSEQELRLRCRDDVLLDADLDLPAGAAGYGDLVLQPDRVTCAEPDLLGRD